jgi:hypothetical protein
MWFDSEAIDFSGHPMRMYSVVTPTEAVEQYYADDEAPIVLAPGVRLVVCGAADGDTNWLWLDIDDSTSQFVNAQICLATAKLQYLCEVGDDLHMKRPS